MTTFIYSPGVKALIHTIREGTIDVSKDIISGDVNRMENAVSTASLELVNTRRKYDGLFTPNDRIVIFLKRIKWVQVFSGYLNRVPYFSVAPRNVSLTASCTLKRLQYHFWDPGTDAAARLLQSRAATDRAEIDGGAKWRAEEVLKTVVGWEPERIHIGSVPSNWLESVSSLHSDVESALEARRAVGAAPTVAGQSPSNMGNGRIEISDASLQSLVEKGAIGQLPATSGQISWFGGPRGGAYGTMQLTGESGSNPGDASAGDPNGDWFCAMRFPYMQSNPSKANPNEWRADLTQQERRDAVAWWRNRKIVAFHPGTQKSIVLRCADWGPAEWTGKTLDMAEHALKVGLGGDNGDEVSIYFPPDPDTPVGPYTPPLAGSVVADAIGAVNTGWDAVKGAITTGVEKLNEAAALGSVQIPAPIPVGATPSKGDFSWGGYSNGKIPLDALVQTSASGGTNTTNYMHPIAAQSWEQMKQAAAQDGITLDGSCYRTYAGQEAVAGPKAATPGFSNHGWAFAFDFALGGGHFSSPVYKWLEANAWRFGWVHPVWARLGGSNPEAWHWEFWGIFNFERNNRDVTIRPGNFAEAPGGTGGQPTIINGITVTSGGAGGAGGTTGIGGTGRTLFNPYVWESRAQDVLSNVLAGPWAYLNDTPVMPYIKSVLASSSRNFCSAPNGDFISWFPDYFGLYGTCGVMGLKSIEVKDFTIDWSDERLKTHWYVIGGLPQLVRGDPQGFVAAVNTYLTQGIASIEFPEVLSALLGTDYDSEWGDAVGILERFGARPQTSNNGNIEQGPAEFFLAIHGLMQNWSEQFSTQMPLMFMPELYPGMLARLDEQGVQMYVTSVRHSFNFSTGGFTTSAGVTAPSRTDGTGLYGMARTNPIGPRGSSTGMDLSGSSTLAVEDDR